MFINPDFQPSLCLASKIKYKINAKNRIISNGEFNFLTSLKKTLKSNCEKISEVLKEMEE